MERVDGPLTIRFRVGSVLKNRVVRVYLDGNAILEKKRPVMAPGEMEEVRLTKSLLSAHPSAAELTIAIEEEAG